MLKKPVVAEIAPLGTGNRRWIEIRPVRERHRLDPNLQPDGRFEIRQFEFSGDADVDDWDIEPIGRPVVELVDSVEEAERLAAHYVDLDEFTVPWRSEGYPY